MVVGCNNTVFFFFSDLHNVEWNCWFLSNFILKTINLGILYQILRVRERKMWQHSLVSPTKRSAHTPLLSVGGSSAPLNSVFLEPYAELMRRERKPTENSKVDTRWPSGDGFVLGQQVASSPGLLFPESRMKSASHERAGLVSAVIAATDFEISANQNESQKGFELCWNLTKVIKRA